MSILFILLTIIYINYSHFVSDFIMQSDEMAKGKSTSLIWLSKHVLAYYLCLLWFSGIYLLFIDITFEIIFLMVYYCTLNGVLHFITDYFTSKLVKRFFNKGDIHKGFVVIGLDQFIHISTLILSFYFIFHKFFCY